MKRKHLIFTFAFLVIAITTSYIFYGNDEPKPEETTALFQEVKPGPGIGDKDLLLQTLQVERDTVRNLLDYEVIIKDGKKHFVDRDLVFNTLLFIDYKIEKAKQGTYQTAKFDLVENADSLKREGIYKPEDLYKDTLVFVVPPLSFLEFEQFKVNKVLDYYYNTNK